MMAASMTFRRLFLLSVAASAYSMPIAQLESPDKGVLTKVTNDPSPAIDPSTVTPTPTSFEPDLRNDHVVGWTPSSVDPVLTTSTRYNGPIPESQPSGREDFKCSSSKRCPNASLCCSEFGYCGETSEYCNARSIWLPSGAASNGTEVYPVRNMIPANECNFKTDDEIALPPPPPTGRSWEPTPTEKPVQPSNETTNVPHEAEVTPTEKPYQPDTGTITEPPCEATPTTQPVQPDEGTTKWDLREPVLDATPTEKPRPALGTVIKKPYEPTPKADSTEMATTQRELSESPDVTTNVIGAKKQPRKIIKEIPAYGTRWPTEKATTPGQLSKSSGLTANDIGAKKQPETHARKIVKEIPVIGTGSPTSSTVTGAEKTAPSTTPLPGPTEMLHEALATKEPAVDKSASSNVDAQPETHASEIVDEIPAIEAESVKDREKTSPSTTPLPEPTEISPETLAADEPAVDEPAPGNVDEVPGVLEADEKTEGKKNDETDKREAEGNEDEGNKDGFSLSDIPENLKNGVVDGVKKGKEILDSLSNFGEAEKKEENEEENISDLLEGGKDQINDFGEDVKDGISDIGDGDPKGLVNLITATNDLVSSDVAKDVLGIVNDAVGGNVDPNSILDNLNRAVEGGDKENIFKLINDAVEGKGDPKSIINLVNGATGLFASNQGDKGGTKDPLNPELGNTNGNDLELGNSDELDSNDPEDLLNASDEEINRQLNLLFDEDGAEPIV